MKHNHTSLKAKALKNPNRVFKDLKQKQKGKISNWLYIETYRYYETNKCMPNDTECNAILETVYTKIKGAAIWIPFEEISAYYQKRLPQYEIRIQREFAEGVHYPTRAERLAEKAAKPKPPKKRKKKKKKTEPQILDYSDIMDDEFSYIAGYTDGGAPYGVRWEDVGIPSDLPFNVKRALYMEEYDLDDEE